MAAIQEDRRQEANGGHRGDDQPVFDGLIDCHVRGDSINPPLSSFSTLILAIALSYHGVHSLI
jgi:hypothetical protein